MARAKKADEKAKETDAATIQISVDDFVRTRDAVSFASMLLFIFDSPRHHIITNNAAHANSHHECLRTL
jgi:hypothetical protein